MPPTHRRPNLSEIILVLWGAGGDEAAAILFISELRAAGIAVKLVGLGGNAIKGYAGVGLVPDLTLGDALSFASRVTHIVLPFDDNTLNDFRTDPRLHKLIAAAHDHGALFVQSDSIDESATLPTLFPPRTPYKLIRYPKGAALYEFVPNFCANKGAEVGSNFDPSLGPPLADNDES